MQDYNLGAFWHNVMALCLVDSWRTTGEVFYVNGWQCDIEILEE